MNNVYTILAASILTMTANTLAVAEEAAPFPGTKSQWNGYDRYDFTVDEAKCWVVVPKQAAEGRPWIWRARFFGHEPQADLALLAKGFHLTYCDVAALFGSPKAVARWDKFYRLMTEKHGLAKKVALEGMSRGGLIIYNFAAAYPDRVACIYADAPVCDFKSWPGGRGTGPGSAGDWKTCLNVYGLTEAEALAYPHNPIDNLKPITDAGIPLLHVVGLDDRVVPVAENTKILEQRYQQLGGSFIQVVEKPGVGHHPHSLKDPKPIVDFVLKYTGQ